MRRDKIGQVNRSTAGPLLLCTWLPRSTRYISSPRLGIRPCHKTVDRVLHPVKASSPDCRCMYDMLHSAATSDGLAAYEACFFLGSLLDSGRRPSAFDECFGPTLPSDSGAVGTALPSSRMAHFELGLEGIHVLPTFWQRLLKMARRMDYPKQIPLIITYKHNSHCNHSNHSNHCNSTP